MSETNFGKIRNLGPSEITVTPNRMRALRPDVVAVLVESMAKNGLLAPLVVRPSRGAGFNLVAGRHRLAAAKQLKWESIACKVMTGISADKAQLAEIDENLVRAELSPAERAMHIGRRKELYEKLYPQTKHGGDRRSKSSRQVGDSNKRFTKETAKAASQSERNVQRDATRAKDVVVLPDIVGTSLDKGEELDALAKLPVKDQKQLAKQANAGENVSAKPQAKKNVRATREAELGAKQIALPTRQYGVILEDFEWDDEVYSRDTGMDRHASNHYETSESAHTAEEAESRSHCCGRLRAQPP